MPKKDDFIIKLARQVDANSKDIKTILESLSTINSLLTVKETPPVTPLITSPIEPLKPAVEPPVVQTDVFNIQASFNHQVTVEDRAKVQKIGQTLSQALMEMGVKDFKMTFKK